MVYCGTNAYRKVYCYYVVYEDEGGISSDTWSQSTLNAELQAGTRILEVWHRSELPDLDEN